MYWKFHIRWPSPTIQRAWCSQNCIEIYIIVEYQVVAWGYLWNDYNTEFLYRSLLSFFVSYFHVLAVPLFQMSFHLPPRAEGYPWRLVYSSESHGFSLRTLYRSMHRIDSPILLIIQETRGHVNIAPLGEGRWGGGGEGIQLCLQRAMWVGRNELFTVYCSNCQ